ncbi:MAG: ChrR family anti-sigma-E factor [Hyphomicrobiales bacterium]|nr:ChrR family anti-sigma-E factor [Hyphomicrobiales bacterium]
MTSTPRDALLAGYAAGSLTPALQALVAAHLHMRPDNRAFVDALDDEMGTVLAMAPQAPCRHRDDNLARIFTSADPAVAAPARDTVFPAPLRAFLGFDAKDVRWRFLLPGVKCHVIAREATGAATLYKIRPGRKMPFHTHDGNETTLVLQGSFADNHGTYEAGDLAFADPAVNHRPVAGSEGECLCFAVTDAPLRLTGRLGRFFESLQQRPRAI